MNLEYIYYKVLKKLQGRALRNVAKGREVKIYSGCQIYDSSIGDFSYCGSHTIMVNVEVGKFCSIAGGVTIGSAEHPMDWVSMSPVFENVKNSGTSVRFAKEELPPVKRTYIGNDVWIGAGAKIKQGVIVGNGAVIGALAMVTKDVPPYAVVGGVPAKIIRYRFSKDLIARLNASEWWNLDDNALKNVGKYIKKPEVFLSKIEDKKESYQ